MSDNKPTEIDTPSFVIKEFSCEAVIGCNPPPNPGVRLKLTPVDGQALECAIDATLAIQLWEAIRKEASDALASESKRRWPDRP